MSAMLLIAAQDPKVHLTSQTRILAAVIALGFMLMILELIRRNRLQERFSVVWFVAGLGMLAAQLQRDHVPPGRPDNQAGAGAGSGESTRAGTLSRERQAGQ